MQLETDEHWFSLIGFFNSQQNDDQKLEIIQPLTKESLLVEIFKVLRTGYDDILKINLLIFIEENSDFFFGNNQTSLFQGTCTLLNELLTLPSGSSSPSVYRVKSQVLITLTSIIIYNDTITSQPSAVNALIDLLFDYISKTNNPYDIILRQTACECLRELNQHFSGIFSQNLGFFMSLLQDEKTFAHQSYTTLFSSSLVSTIDIMHQIINSTVQSKFETGITENEANQLENKLTSLLGKFKSSHHGSLNIKLFRKSMDTSFISPPFELINKPFQMRITVPKRPHHMMIYLRSQLRNALRLIIESLPIVSPIESVRLMLDILFLISNSTIYNLEGKMTESEDPPVNIKDLIAVLKPFLRSHNLLLWNVVNLFLCGLPYHQISEVYVELRPILDDNLLNLLKSHFDDVLDELRFSSISWLTNGISRYQSDKIVSLASVINPYKSKFLPTPFDSYYKLNTKLYAITYFYEKKIGSKLSPPDDFMKIMTILNDFTYYNTNDEKTIIVFRILTHYIRTFPSQFENIFEYLAEKLVIKPELETCIIRMIKHVVQSKYLYEEGIHKVFLNRITQFLSKLKPPNMFNYIGLIMDIIQYKFLNINKILSCILTNLRCSQYVSQGDWLFGNTILKIVHLVILQFNIDTVRVPLMDILLYLKENYSDVEIRDRSKFYYLLLLHVPIEQIKNILSDDIEVTSHSDQSIQLSHEETESEINDESKLLSIERLFPLYNYNCVLYLSKKFKSTQDESVDFNCLELYYQFLELNETYEDRTDRDMFTIQLPYMLSYNNLIENDDGSDSISLFSVKLQIKGSEINLNQCYTIEIPILSQNRDDQEITTSPIEYGDKVLTTVGTFPTSYTFILSIQVPIPIPTSYNVKVTYNTQSGEVKEINLDPIHITLRDMMLPIPHYSHHYRHNYDKKSYLTKLFSEMWEDEKLKESVKFIESEREKIIQRVRENLLPFLVDQDQLETDNIDIFIFLPRKFHLLFKLSVKERRTVIKIKTDYLRILSFVDKYFEELFR